jgi:hypothetical protein
MAVDWLRDSTTFRAIFEGGFVKGFAKIYSRLCPNQPDRFPLECRREWLYFLGEEWLGPPPAEVIDKIDAISEESKPEELVEKLTDSRRRISTWDELLSAR